MGTPDNADTNYVKERAGVCGGVELMRKERVERP